MKDEMKKYWGLLIVLLLSFWAVKPLLSPGFFPIHDDTQVVRVQQMAQALNDGQRPVRWVRDLGYGYGYPIFNFYAPLAYYLGGFLNLAGLDALTATKLMMALGVLLAGITMYFLAREFWGEKGAILSALFYVYAPYHALDVYVRGAVSEFWAVAFLPLVFWGLWQIFQNKRWGVMIAGLGLAAVVLSHNLTAMMAVPFLLLVVLVLVTASKKRKLFVRRLSISALLGFSLSAFYWLPALFEMNLTKVLGQIGGGADWRDHFVYLDQLWASPWGFGGSAPGRLDGMSFMIGKFHLLIVAFSLAAGFWLWQKRKKKEVLAVLVGLMVLVTAVFSTNELSWLVWERISILAFVQYPWRFLIFATLAASFLAGSILKLLNFRPLRPLSLLFPCLATASLVALLLFLNTKYFQPQFLMAVTAADYLGEENIKWETSKISDEYLPKDFPVPEDKNDVAWEKVAVIAGEAEVENISRQSHRLSFDVNASSEAQVVLNLAYFPGWKIELDGKEASFGLENGKIKLSLSEGNHRILAYFTNTPIRTIANLISLISFLVLMTFFTRKKIG